MSTFSLLSLKDFTYNKYVIFKKSKILSFFLHLLLFYGFIYSFRLFLNKYFKVNIKFDKYLFKVIRGCYIFDNRSDFYCFKNQIYFLNLKKIQVFNHYSSLNISLRGLLIYSTVGGIFSNLNFMEKGGGRLLVFFY